MNNTRIVIYLIIFFLLKMHILMADVRVADIFQEHMVLQQKMIVPVWGTSSSGEKVTVQFNNQKKSTVADSEGHWKIELDAMDSGGPFTMTINGNDQVQLKDILIGEVWICSGQSNMLVPLINSNKGDLAASRANYPEIRFFQVSKGVAEFPQTIVEGQWNVCNSNTAKRLSAVAYYFGEKLYHDIKVPIGLIQSAYGGTAAEAWTPVQAMQFESDYEPIFQRYVTEVFKGKGDGRRNYDKMLKQWRRDARNAQRKKKPVPTRPMPPLSDGTNIKETRRPGGLYNKMIAPIISFSFRGVIWYQGEANRRRAYQYRKLFPALIASWRTHGKRGDFPFLYVQIANYSPQKDEPYYWAELREAQLLTLQLPNTAMAVTIDIGDSQDIHPKNKSDVGCRLALCALAKVYNWKIVYSGPLYESMKVKGKIIQIKFKHSEGGLVCKGDELVGFEIAGENKLFVPAKTKISNGMVLVTSDKIKRPVAVRYAWQNDPKSSLYNKEGLPASPFRTDQWTRNTYENK